MQDLILNRLKSDLADSLVDYQPQPIQPLITNPYIAMSVLQKGIRRNETTLAFRAGLTLLRDSPRALWRRLGITAFEDIGIANIPLVGQAACCLGAKRFRSALGGDWKVASYLIEQMCKSTKERSSDDLLVQLIHDPALDELKQQIAELPIGERLAGLSSSQPIAQAALTAWLCYGSDRLRETNIPEVMGDPTALFETLLDMAFCPTVIEIAKLGIRKTRDILPLFLPLLWEASRDQEVTIQADDLPEIKTIGEIPSYVFDSHTRDGNRCFREFITQSQKMKDFLKRCNAPRTDWSRIVGRLAFRIESGLVSERLTWNTGSELLHKANMLGRGIPARHVPEGLRLMQLEISTLNRIRSGVLGGEGE